MVIMENQSGLPEDRFVNTWHFVADGGDLFAASLDIQQQLEAFYNVGGPNSISHFISSKVLRTPGVTQTRYYNLADVPPREPVIREWTLGPGASFDNLPNEVAVTMSFYSDRNLPRQRGRLYLGPLRTNAMADRVGDQGVSTEFRNAIGQSLTNRANALAAGDATWSTHSETTGELHPVSHIWVDDAFDTIRKRGKDPTNRVEWAATGTILA